MKKKSTTPAVSQGYHFGRTTMALNLAQEALSDIDPLSIIFSEDDQKSLKDIQEKLRDLNWGIWFKFEEFRRKNQ